MTTSPRTVLEAIEDRTEDLGDALIMANEAVEREQQTRDEIEAELGRLRQAREVLCSPGDGNDPPPAPEQPPNEPSQAQEPAGESDGDSAPEPDPLPGNGNRSDPEAPPRRPAKGLTKAAQGERTREAVLAAVQRCCDQSGKATMRDLLPHVDVGRKGVSAALNRLIDDGKVEAHGDVRSSKRYYTLVESKTPVTPPAERKKPGEASERSPKEPGATHNTNRQPPSLEGRVLDMLGWHPGGLTGPALGLELEVPLHDVRPVLGKLMREGEVRTKKKGGDTLYVKAMVAA